MKTSAQKVFFAFFVLSFSTLVGAQDIDQPDYISVKIQVKNVQHVRDGQNFNQKGFVSKHVQFYVGSPEIQVSDEAGQVYDSSHKKIWITLGSAAEQNELFSLCRKHSFASLNGGQFTFSASQIPFGYFYNSPVDWSDLKRLEREAGVLEKSAKAKWSQEQQNHQSVQAQIVVAKNALNATKDSKQKVKLAAQVAGLEQKSNQILDNGKAAFARQMEQVEQLRERAKKIAAKIASELAGAEERAAKIQQNIDNLNEKIAKAKEPAQVEKLKVQLMMAEDRLQKIKAELVSMRPGMRGHLNLNINKFKISCE